MNWSLWRGDSGGGGVGSVGVRGGASDGELGRESNREEEGKSGARVVERTALGSLPGTQVLEDAEDDARVLDEGQSPHWMRASRTDQRLDFVDSLVDVNVHFSGRKRSFIRRFRGKSDRRLIGGTGRSGAIYSETVFAVFFDSRHGGLETTATTRFPICYLQPRLEQFRYG